jgi:hypothetical protein
MLLTLAYVVNEIISDRPGRDGGASLHGGRERQSGPRRPDARVLVLNDPCELERRGKNGGEQA